MAEGSNDGVPKEAIMSVLYSATQQEETAALFTSTERDDGEGYELQNVTDITDHLNTLEAQESPNDAFVRGFLTAQAWRNTYNLTGPTDMQNVARKFARGEKDLAELHFDRGHSFGSEDLTP